MTDPAAPLTLSQALAELVHTITPYVGTLMLAGVPAAAAYFNWMRHRFQETADKLDDATKEIQANTHLTTAIQEDAAKVKQALEVHTEKTEAKMETLAANVEKGVRLANGAMSSQKEMTAEASRIAADLSGDPLLIAKADIAERSLEAHKSALAASDTAAIVHAAAAIVTADAAKNGGDKT